MPSENRYKEKRLKEVNYSTYSSVFTSYIYKIKFLPLWDDGERGDFKHQQELCPKGTPKSLDTKGYECMQKKIGQRHNYCKGSGTDGKDILSSGFQWG